MTKFYQLGTTIWKLNESGEFEHSFECPGVPDVELTDLELLAMGAVETEETLPEISVPEEIAVYTSEEGEIKFIQRLSSTPAMKEWMQNIQNAVQILQEKQS